MNTETATLGDELEASFNALRTPVIDLVQRVTNIEPTTSELETGGLRITSPLEFPDGVGAGAVTAELFRYRNEIRVDLRVEHNRMFATAEGQASDRRCFLNDYIASVTLSAGVEELPASFVRNIVAGVSAARDAVGRHNRNCKAPWNEVRVAAAETCVTVR